MFVFGYWIGDDVFKCECWDDKCMFICGCWNCKYAFMFGYWCGIFCVWILESVCLYVIVGIIMCLYVDVEMISMCLYVDFRMISMRLCVDIGIGVFICGCWGDKYVFICG